MSLPTEKSSPYRIAILGIYHESNTFATEHTTIQDFKSSRWLAGVSILKEYEHAHHEIGGAMEVFLKNGVSLLPIFYAEATPGGIIEESAFHELLSAMMQGIDEAPQAHAFFVVPHGAAVAENHLDMDGEWLQKLRERIGPNIPIVGTLDPHANVSERMVNATQGLFPYCTNPHTDQRETGKTAANFLLDILNKRIDPVQTLFQAPLSISIEQQETAVTPCKDLYQFAKKACQRSKTLFINLTLGFPYADVPEMGAAAIIIADGDKKGVEKAKNQLLGFFTKNREQFVGKKEDIKKTLSLINKKEKPVLLLDMGDNVGGGALGDSTYLLEHLDQINLKTCIAIYAPDAVNTCKKHSINDCFQLSFGRNPETGHRYTAIVKLVSLHDGLFHEDKPRHGGQRSFNMGDSAVVFTANNQTVLLHSKRMPPFSLAQLTSCQIDPGSFEVIIAKGVIAPLAAYKPFCKTAIKVNSPGVTQADMTKFNFINRRKPLFPFEK